ncbi:MAG: alpha-2-macroglobulin family protein [Acidobacteriota bacterium]
MRSRLSFRRVPWRAFLRRLAWLIVPAAQLAVWGSVPLVAETAAILTAPKKLHAGSPSSFTLTLLDAQSREPASGQVAVRLRSTDGALIQTVYSGLINGRNRVEFDVPSTTSGSVVLSAEVAGIGQPLEIDSVVDRSPAVLIETDKPIYKPSQTIHGRVVLLDSRLRPVEGDVEVTIHDAKGIRVARFDLEADRYGVAPFSLELASELNLGTWKARAKSQGAESLRDIRVEEYTLPRFEIGVEFEKPWALVDETVRGSVDARYFFGKAVQGTAWIRAKRWIGEWQEYAEAEGALSDGHMAFELQPVEFVTGTVEASGQGTVLIEAGVTDSTGHEESTSEVLTITQAPVVVALIPSSKDLKPGIPTDLLVQTETPEGSPLGQHVDVEVEFFDWNQHRLKTREFALETQGGSGHVFIDAPENAAYANISAEAVRDAHRTRVEIYLGSAYSSSRSFLALNRVGSDPVTVGDIVSFSTASTEPGTVYYEVFASGRTVLSDAVESENFQFPVTAEMVPRAKVVAYRIGTNNEVAADSVSFAVGLPVSVSLSAGFDAAQVRPGDPVEVTLDAGTNGPVLLGVSIVDRSVLALGESRLHLASVFEELERRFLEPQIEIHEGESGEGPPFGFSAESPGALDVINEAGLDVATTPNLQIDSGQDWFFEGVGGGIGPPPPISPLPGTADTGSGPAQVPPRLRQFFPETWVWEPILLSDDTGKATLTLTAPDSITSWALAVVGTTPDVSGDEAGILFGESELTVFQDFFVEPSLPYSVVRGESFQVKVDVFNYLDQPQSIGLELKGSEGFEILSQNELATTVPANNASSVEFLIQPTAIGDFPLEITAIGNSASDAVLRTLKVIPEGVQTERIENGVIESGQSVPLDVPTIPGMVPDSLRTILYLSPSPVAQTMKGVSDLLGMPYGCGEQNMIFLAPDIEILKYLREIGELAPEIRAEAEYYITVGYQRELTFRSDDLGFAAFGGEQGSLWLTAFVLSTFSEAREVRDIDESVLSGAAAMLMARQLNDGSYETDDFLIHKDMDGGLANLFAMTAYVAKALAEYGGTEVGPSVLAAGGYLTAHLTDVWDDPYSLALGAVCLQQVPGFEDAAEGIIDRLLQLAMTDETGMYWTPYPVETTGYATVALLNSHQSVGRPEAQSAVDWLSTQRNSLGGYGYSTQDTVVALRALFEAARKLHRDLNVELSILEGDRILHTTVVDESNFDVLQQFELPSDGGPYTLQSVGTGSVGYQWAQRFNFPGQFLPPSSDMTLSVDYLSDHVEVDDLVDVQVSVEYTGPKAKTGMAIVDVGVPTGFEAVSDSLDALRTEDVVSRVEVAGRKIIFYLDELVRGTPVHFGFQVRALFPVRAEGPVSSAYEYYDSSARAYDVQEEVRIDEPPEITSVSTEELVPGETVVVSGHGFTTGILTVSIGGTEIKDVRLIDDSTLLVTIPRLPSGPASLTIQTGSHSLSWDDGGLLRITATRLYFPLYPTSEDGFSGFALVNHSETPAHLEFELRTRAGGMAIAPTNPSVLELGAGAQLAMLGEEIFGKVSLDGPAWVEMRSDNPQVSGYSLYGTGRELDNLGSLRSTASRLHFTHVLQGPTAFLGERATTRIGLANPGEERVSIQLALQGISEVDGGGVYNRRFADIAAGGTLQGDLDELFGSGASKIRDAHVLVEVLHGEGVVGYQMTEFPDRDSVIGTAPQSVLPVTMLYAPHVAQTSEVLTEVNLLNSTGTRQTVQLYLYDTAGEQLRHRTLDLGARQVFRQDLRGTFGLTADQTAEGYLVVECTAPGILGDVWIADPQQLRFATACPLQGLAFRKLVLSQVANGAGVFTGLALLNPGPRSAEVTASVFAADGAGAGEGRFSLEAGHRLVGLLADLVPDSAGLVGGYLVVDSTEPIVVEEILGENDLEYFSIVDPETVD